mgnify:CR=1 FL=1
MATGQDYLDFLLGQRQIREYTDEPVSDDDIWKVLAAAQQGPSGGNIQPWQFVVVTDDSLRRQLGDLYRSAYERYEAAMLPTVPSQRDPAAAASWDRTLAASRHLAEHLHTVAERGEFVQIGVQCLQQRRAFVGIGQQLGDRQRVFHPQIGDERGIRLPIAGGRRARPLDKRVGHAAHRRDDHHQAFPGLGLLLHNRGGLRHRRCAAD